MMPKFLECYFAKKKTRWKILGLVGYADAVKIEPVMMFTPAFLKSAGKG